MAPIDSGNGSNNVLTLRNDIHLYFHKMTHRDTTQKLALRIVKYFRDIIHEGDYNTADQLIQILRVEGELLYNANPSEFLIRNMLLAVLKIVREEVDRLVTGEDEESSRNIESLNTLWCIRPDAAPEVDVEALRQAVVTTISEFSKEIKEGCDSLAQQARHHILPTDIVITYKLGQSDTLKKFFSSVKANTLYSVDDNPTVEANVISSVDILNTMKVATRVVLTAAAILRDGSCIAPAGTLNLCLAAKRHSVPVLVCAAFYKFTPLFIPHLEEFNVQGPPSAVLPASDALKFGNVFVANPLFDRIPSHLISLFITQSSVVSPSHVYRLIVDYYHAEDLRKLNR